MKYRCEVWQGNQLLHAFEHYDQVRLLSSFSEVMKQEIELNSLHIADIDVKFTNTVGG